MFLIATVDAGAARRRRKRQRPLVDCFD